MSALSTYLENKLVDHVLRNTAYTTPGTTIYVGLIKFYDSPVVEAGTLTQEASGGAYARIQVTAWDAASDGATQNTSAITFPDSKLKFIFFKTFITEFPLLNCLLKFFISIKNLFIF